MTQRIPPSQRTNSTRRGAVSVELAVCLPVLIMTLFGVYEFAHVNMVVHATESAAYEAARAAIVPGATTAETESAARNVLNSVGVHDFRMTITPPLSSDADTVRVELQVPFRNNSAVLRLFVADPTFRGLCEMSRESF